MKYFLLHLSVLLITQEVNGSFFQATPNQPRELSVGAVLINQSGSVACQHFTDLFSHTDYYVLMKTPLQDGETPLVALNRGLMEQFGATASPIAFLGCLNGSSNQMSYSNEHTIIYIACQLVDWNAGTVTPEEPGHFVSIEWLAPNDLVPLIQAHKSRAISIDESEMVTKAIPYIPIGL